MNTYEFNNQIEDMSTTMVENAFINHYMPEARGEYVKIYLYGLKCCASGNGMSNSQIAEVLKVSENDVKKAWEYWENEGIIRTDEQGEDFTVEFLAIAPMLFTPGMGVKKKNSKPMSKKFSAMFKDIESKLGRLLSHNEQEIMLMWVEEYKFSTQTVVLLVEDCIKRDKRMIQYWDTMADIYHAEGIKTYDQLQNYIDRREAVNKRNKEIMQYLGIFDTPSKPQRDMIDKWFDSYGFDMDKVKKACDETVKITKPNFAYIDKILTAWHEGKDTPQPPQGAYSAKKNGKTRLENEHNYDVKMLEKALFGDD